MNKSFMPKIGKYYSLKEKAVFTRVKLGAWTFIILSILMIFGNLSSDTKIDVPVRPGFDFPHTDTIISSYGSNHIKLTGKLEIAEPSFIQRLLLPHSFIEFDILNCLLIITLSILTLRLLPHMHSSVLFQKDISNRIRLIGITLMIFWLLDMVRLFAYTVPEISRLTNNQFNYQKNGFLFVPVPFWLGIIVLWINRIYKSAFNLKQEQQLTI